MLLEDATDPRTVDGRAIQEMLSIIVQLEAGSCGSVEYQERHDLTGIFGNPSGPAM
ncbi:hypothetical protein ACPOL_0295 [Acidisarcina polymorpha]|uniref:Uncharacterized protein n=1 Tax=Acidisarcina polymorpha TaxID=2211140 RepID=A0A2Z5FSA3_9BACT|nr:hypothetical protein ACPOL_0295 [Acidisarcina polymorpha]